MKLIKEIRSEKGDLHFLRYELFSTRWFDCYLHKIYKEDLDLHLHNHPWNFFGIVLKGGYIEQTPKGYKNRNPLSFTWGNSSYFHKIFKLNHKESISLFFVGKKRITWGYLTKKGIIDHETYRIMKKNKELGNI